MAKSNAERQAEQQSSRTEENPMATPLKPLRSKEELIADIIKQHPDLTRAEIVEECAAYGFDLDVEPPLPQPAPIEVLEAEPSDEPRPWWETSTNGLVQMMPKAGIPITRENYIGINWGNPPHEMTGEDELELPEQLRSDWDAIPRGYRLCLVEAVQTWLAAAGITEGFVFRSVAKGNRVQAAPLSAHSLRAGFLTSAAEHGVTIFKMMEVSRQRSVDTLRGYVRRAELFRARGRCVSVISLIAKSIGSYQPTKRDRSYSRSSVSNKHTRCAYAPERYWQCTIVTNRQGGLFHKRADGI
jgi:hypothetical protein